MPETITCHNCGQEIYPAYSVCPHCKGLTHKGDKRTQQNKRVNPTPKLVECPSCKGALSERATSCPNCSRATCEICKQNIPSSSETCPACGDPRPFEKITTDNQVTTDGRAEDKSKKILICSYCGTESESLGREFEEGTPCPKCRKLLEEEPQPGQFAQKNDFSKAPTYASKYYFIQHWRGEHSLARSFWINAIAINIIFQLFAAFYLDKIITNVPYNEWYIVLLFSFLSLTVIIWQIVGLWRSANNHIRKTNQRFGAVIANGVMILGVMVFAHQLLQVLPAYNRITKDILGDRDQVSSSSLLDNNKEVEITQDISGDGDHVSSLKMLDNNKEVEVAQDIPGDGDHVSSLKMLANNKEVEITGGIKSGLTEELRKIFNKYPTITVVHLNSYGGRVGEARLLKEFIEEKELTTSTNRGCLSACTIAYMGGSSRLVYGEKKLGFHQYTSATTAADFNKQSIDASFKEDMQFFEKKGATEEFINKVTDTSPPDLWFPENDILFSNNIITGIARDTDFVIFQEKGSDFYDNIDTMLNDIPVFPVIKQYYPEVYNRIIFKLGLATDSGINDEIKYEEITSFITSNIEPISLSQLPYASDEALIEYIDIVLEIGEKLKIIDPALCYDFYMNGMTSASIQVYLSDSDKSRFFEVLSVVLRSAKENPQPLPEESEVLENIEVLFLEQYSKFGDEIFGWIDPEQVEEVKEEIVCESIKDFFVSVKAFPRNESCKMLRYFFAEGVSE